MKYAFTVLNAAVLKLKFTQALFCFFFVFQHTQNMNFFIDEKWNQYIFMLNNNTKAGMGGFFFWLTGGKIITLSEPIILS